MTQNETTYRAALVTIAAQECNHTCERCSEPESYFEHDSWRGDVPPFGYHDFDPNCPHAIAKRALEGVAK